MTWTPIDFGKHEGLTIPQLLFTDPDYFFWASDQNKFWGYLLPHQAIVAHRRAKGVRIPDRDGVPYAVEYSIGFRTRRVEEVTFVPASRPKHDGVEEVVRRAYLDMSTPREFKTYDKNGMKILLRAMKEFYFGDASYRMTRDRAEAFFDDENNFMNP